MKLPKLLHEVSRDGVPQTRITAVQSVVPSSNDSLVEVVVEVWAADALGEMRWYPADGIEALHALKQAVVTLVALGEASERPPTREPSYEHYGAVVNGDRDAVTVEWDDWDGAPPGSWLVSPDDWDEDLELPFVVGYDPLTGYVHPLSAFEEAERDLLYLVGIKKHRDDHVKDRLFDLYDTWREGGPITDRDWLAIAAKFARKEARDV